MTREETIKKHRELWRWIADETRKRKRTVFKHENPDIMVERPFNNCWLCAYANDCDTCPIKWGENCKDCADDGSPFVEWSNSGHDWKARAYYADIIAELPEKGEK